MKMLMQSQSAICSILPGLAKLHPQNKTTRRQEYPQLWYVWSKIAPRWNKNKDKKTLRRRCLERLCGLLTGHEISKTEWGYGGGGFVDRHCRWCDHLIQIPKVEEPAPSMLEDECGDELYELGFYDNTL